MTDLTRLHNLAGRICYLTPAENREFADLLCKALTERDDEPHYFSECEDNTDLLICSKCKMTYPKRGGRFPMAGCLRRGPGVAESKKDDR